MSYNLIMIFVPLVSPLAGGRMPIISWIMSRKNHVSS